MSVICHQEIAAQNVAPLRAHSGLLVAANADAGAGAGCVFTIAIIIISTFVLRRPPQKDLCQLRTRRRNVFVAPEDKVYFFAFDFSFKFFLLALICSFNASEFIYDSVKVTQPTC